MNRFVDISIQNNQKLIIFLLAFFEYVSGSYRFMLEQLVPSWWNYLARVGMCGLLYELCHWFCCALV